MDDVDKVPSFDAGEAPRRSTSSLGVMGSFASPLEFRTAVCKLFPAFSQEFQLDEAIDTYHQVLMALTPLLAGYLDAESDRKKRAFCAIVNNMVDAGGDQRNAIETCLLEHASQVGCRKLLKPYLSVTAKREFR
jgi:hypothetical protein